MLTQEYIDSLRVFDAMSKEYYKPPSYYRQQILETMNNSQIAEIIGDKRRECVQLQKERDIRIKGTRGEDRDLIDLIFAEEYTAIEKLMKQLQWVINIRQDNERGVRAKIDVNMVKGMVSIVEVIETLMGTKLIPHRLIKCPFPTHIDKTASFKIYTKTNTFFCQGCKRGGSQIDFIKYFVQVDNATAIHKFLQFYRR